MQPNHKPCPICGGEMHRQSKMCYNCYISNKIRPESYITRECPVCGKRFIVHKTQIERGFGKYCSMSCARSGSPTRKKDAPKVICHVCKKEFYKYKSEICKNVGNLHFCSPECWYEHNTNENHYNWESGQNERMNSQNTEWRKKVLRRDKYFCRLCHRRRNLEVHHIKRFATHPELRWDIDNGITLCKECHKKFQRVEEEYEEIFDFIASIPIEVIYV